MGKISVNIALILYYYVLLPLCRSLEFPKCWLRIFINPTLLVQWALKLCASWKRKEKYIVCKINLYSMIIAFFSEVYYY
jgi:hypothetical protein